VLVGGCGFVWCGVVGMGEGGFGGVGGGEGGGGGGGFKCI